MSTDVSLQQQSVANWFDAIYRRKGDAYLRPTRAYTVFLELLAAKPGERLLDVACGLGRLLEAAEPYGVVSTGIDISSVAVAAARRNVAAATIEQGNAEALPFDDQTFDLVTCIGSLERLLDSPRALAEMRRVGKADARYCVMLRNAATLGWRLRSALPFARNTGNAGADTLEGWTRLLEDNGFTIQAVLPDQYPLHRRARWRSLFLQPVDFSRPVDAPLESANEFVFVLEKA